jgi:O-antigen/teichoic acid export membrane protein
LFGLVGQATTAAFTAVLTVYLVRKLGPSGYGVFSLAISVSGVALMISDFGLAPSAGRFIAERADDLPHLRRVTDTALALKLVGAAAVAVLLYALAGPIADAYGEPRLGWPLRTVAIALCFETLLMLYTSAFGALRRVVLNAQTIFIESLVETTASIALVALGAGVTGAVAGRAAGYAAGVVVGAVLLTRLVGRPHPRRGASERELARTITAYARPLLIINGAYTLYAYVDTLLIGALLTSADVGEFSAPLRLVTMLGYLGQAVATAVAPRLAGDRPDVPAFTGALRLLVILQMLLIVPLLAWSQPIVDLVLGSDYRHAGDVLLGLAPYALLFGVGPLITMTVTFSGGAHRRVPIVLSALALNAVVDLALLPTVGVVGAAVGTGLAAALYVPAHLRVCVQTFGFDLRPVLVTFGRSLAAAAVATGVLLLFGRDDLAPWQWVAGGLTAPLAFGAVLVALGELDRGDLEAVRARLRRR